MNRTISKPESLLEFSAGLACRRKLGIELGMGAFVTI
jgi:hypothetical protein